MTENVYEVVITISREGKKTTRTILIPAMNRPAAIIGAFSQEVVCRGLTDDSFTFQVESYERLNL